MNPRNPETLWLLLALVPYAALAATFLSRLRSWTAGGFDASLSGSRGKRYMAARTAGAAAAALFWALGTLAAAGMSLGTRYVSRRTEGAEIAVALDVSNSMLIDDAGTSRLEASLDFIRAVRAAQGSAAASGARWSLIAFRGSAVSLCPPTRDAQAFDSALSWAGPGVSDAPGSDLGAAISLAARGIGPGTERVIIALSDGNDTGGDARLEAIKAAEAGARLVFIGIGGLEAKPVFDEAGMPIMDKSGKQASLGLNETVLAELARASRGTYLRIDDPRAFTAVAAAVRDASGAPGSWRDQKVPVDASPGFAALALAALAASILLSRPPARRAKAGRP